MSNWPKYPTIDPRNPQLKIEVKIPIGLIEHFQKYLTVQFFNLYTVAKVLDSPERIFHGIRSVNEGGWCYVGKPDTWYIRDNVTAPFPKDKVYAVYLNPGFVLYEFRAEFSDAQDQFCPKDWENRYGRLAWKKTH